MFSIKALIIPLRIMYIMLNKISKTAPDLVALPQLISIVGAAPDGFDHK